MLEFSKRDCTIEARNGFQVEALLNDPSFSYISDFPQSQWSKACRMHGARAARMHGHAKLQMKSIRMVFNLGNLCNVNSEILKEI